MFERPIILYLLFISIGRANSSRNKKTKTQKGAARERKVTGHHQEAGAALFMRTRVRSYRPNLQVGEEKSSGRRNRDGNEKRNPNTTRVIRLDKNLEVTKKT